MTKEEFGKIVVALKTFYPSDKMLPNEQSVSLWYEMLKDIEYGTLNVAVSKWVLTNRFYPTIADLRRISSEIVNGEKSDFGHGWQKVINAISRYGYYSPEEAFETFDDITLQCVKRLGWSNLCLSENQTADRARFAEIYEQIQDANATRQQLPDALKKMIDSQNKILIDGGD